MANETITLYVQSIKKAEECEVVKSDPGSKGTYDENPFGFNTTDQNDGVFTT